MSRARILADYVSSGDELALKAPIAGPTFTGTVGGLGTPVINLGSATGALPVGVTGGSGLNAVNPTNLAAGLFGAIERTSLTSPDTITATCTTGDTLVDAGSISADLFGSSSVTLFGGVSQTNAAITFDYGVGVTKYLRYIKWKQVDGAGNSTGIYIRASTNGSSWTSISTITSAIVNGTTYSFTNTGTTAYRYWQVQYTWSSANRGNVQDFIIHESDSSTLTTLSPATSFPTGHISNVFRFSSTSAGSEYANSTTDNKVMVDPISWTTVSGRHYFIISSMFIAPYRESGSPNVVGQNNYMFYGTVDRSVGDAAAGESTGGFLWYETTGHYNPAGTYTGTDNLYANIAPMGGFTAGSSATHYMYMSAQPFTGDMAARMAETSEKPWNTIIFEIIP